METMEDIKINKPKKKIKWGIIVPVIVAILIVIVALYIDSLEDKPKPPKDNTELIFLDPVTPEENPKRKEEITDYTMYGCASPNTIKPVTIEEPDKEWVISEKGARISLGKYRIINPSKTITDFLKLWLYFFSEDLSDRDDNLYGLEKSYTKGITLIVNGKERAMKLGGDEYMFIELEDYPLGDLYPYDKKYGIDFEFVVDLKCNEGCLDNQGQSLENIDNADIAAQIRIFAKGCEEFQHDMRIESRFKYGN